MNDDLADSTPAKPGFLKGRQPSVRDMLVFYAVGVLFVAGAGAAWYLAKELLLFFACVLFAIILKGASKKFERWFHVSHWLALSAAVFGLGGWLMAPQMEVMQELGDTLSQWLLGKLISMVVVVTVLVIMLYVQDTLKEPVKTPAEH